MNKILRCAAVAAMAVGFSLPTLSQADAASVALVPLVNNVVEREDLGQIYFDRAIEAMKSGNSELVDDQKVDQAMTKVVKQGVLPTEADLRTIAEEGNVDVVIAMQVDELVRTDIMMDNAMEQEYTLNLSGKCAYFDAMTGKYKLVKFSDNDRQPLSVGARYDVEGEIFANTVTRQVRRILGIKKFVFEKPRISGAGLKGNRK